VNEDEDEDEEVEVDGDEDEDEEPTDKTICNIIVDGSQYSKYGMRKILAGKLVPTAYKYYIHAKSNYS
jgi:hypothetical protein